jgi:hypothetical protein
MGESIMESLDENKIGMTLRFMVATVPALAGMPSGGGARIRRFCLPL